MVGAAVAYLRVSGASQIDGTGFDRQHQSCAEYAQQNGLHLVDVFRAPVTTAKLAPIKHFRKQLSVNKT